MQWSTMCLARTWVPIAKGSRAVSSPAPKLYVSLKDFSINPPPNRFKFLLHEALCQDKDPLKQVVKVTKLMSPLLPSAKSG